jgi:hypothetical protein
MSYAWLGAIAGIVKVFSKELRGVHTTLLHYLVMLKPGVIPTFSVAWSCRMVKEVHGLHWEAA